MKEWERAVLCLEKALKLSKEVFDCSHLQVKALKILYLTPEVMASY